MRRSSFVRGSVREAMRTPEEIPYESAIPISYGSTEVFETGRWGFQKPFTRFKIAPCQEACPAGIDIPQFLYFINEGKMEEALLTILKENPLPGVCGRVCLHPCEVNCNRGQFDESVSIQALERYTSDSVSNGVGINPITHRFPKRVAIVGGGPAGLSCAYFLSLLGHRVTIFEAKREAGGVMRWGIPDYRLPKTVLKREIQRIFAFPIEIETGVRVGKDILFDELDQYDAIFLSPGADLNTSLGIRGEELPRVLMGRELLEKINSGEKVSLGKETIVIGGGNTAIDVARSALRLGSKVTVVYRRTRDEMPALPDEIDEAEEEGIQFEFLSRPVEISSAQRKRLIIKFQRMKIKGLDPKGRRRAIPVKGDYFTLKADHLITAIGEQIDLSWIPKEYVQKGLIDIRPSAKVFAGGDAIDQPRTLVNAIASGKRAAISIDLFFQGESIESLTSRIRVGNKGSISMESYLSWKARGQWPEPQEVVSYPQINTLYFSPSRRIGIRKRPLAKRLRSFLEVNMGLKPDRARFSASRCFSCGTCNYCYNCYFFCPEGAVALDPINRTRTVDYQHCKGCGTCVKACPRNIVEMRSEP